MSEPPMPGIANAGQSQHSPDDASDPPISERASDHFVEEEDKKPWKPPSLAKWYIMWLVFAFIEILTSAEKASFNHLGTTFNDYFDNYRILSIGTLSYMTASAVFKPLTGRLTDIFSDTTGMLVGNGLYVLGCGICAGAYFLPPAVGQSIFLIGRTLIGVGSGTISSILNKFKDACSEKWHFFMRWLFTLYAATGSSVGPWVGGLIISSRWGWHPTFWGQGVSILLCAIVTHCTICELPKDTKKTKNQPASAQDLEAEHVDEPDDPLELPEPDDPEAEASALEAPETPAPETPLSIRQKLLLIDWVGMVLYAVGMVLMITGSNAISSKGIATCVALIALSIVFFFLFFSWGKLLQKRKRGRKEARAQAQAQGDPVAHTAPVDNLDSVRLTSAQREMEGSSTSVPTSAAQTGPEDIHERIAPRDTGETLTSAPTGIDRSATSRTWGSIPTLVKFFVAKNLSHVGTSFSGAGKAAVKAGFDFGAWFYEVYPEVKPFIKTRLLTDWSALSICLTSGINHTSYWLFKIHIPVYLAVHGLNKRAAGTWMVAPGIASFAGPWIIGLIGYLVRTARKRPTKEEIEAREHERTRQRNRRLLAGRAERRSIRRNLLFIAISCTIGMLLCAIATVVSAQSTLPYKVTILLFAGITACYAPLGNLVQVTIKRAARKPDDVTDTKSLLFAVRSICDALGVVWGSFLYSQVLRTQLEKTFDKKDPGDRKHIEDLLGNAAFLKDLPEVWKVGATKAFRFALLVVMSAGAGVAVVTFLTLVFATCLIVPYAWGKKEKERQVLPPGRTQRRSVPGPTDSTSALLRDPSPPGRRPATPPPNASSRGSSRSSRSSRAGSQPRSRSRSGEGRSGEGGSGARSR